MIWTANEAQQMLQQLGQPWLPPSIDALTALVRSWIFTVPFHNLDLLVGTSPKELPTAAEACLRVRGGGCHVHAAGFTALLQALGYDVELTGADITVVGDHLMVKVRIDDQLFWCDVGNGQPYLVPFRHNDVTTCEHLGWFIAARPTDNGMVLLRQNRLMPHWRRVYVTSLKSYTWDDFSVAIKRHHSEPGFGPFLTGLRVTKINASTMIMIRDRDVAIWRADAIEQLQHCSVDQLAAMIMEVVADPDGVFRALHVWTRQSGEPRV